MSIHDYQSAMDTYRALLRTARRLKRIIRPLFAEWGLTGAQYGTISRIPPSGISLSELASMSSADAPTVSGIVDRLVKAGIARRQRSEQDRRVVLIFLTEKGTSIVENVAPLYKKAVLEALSSLGPQEQETLRHLLAKVVATISEEEGN